ncbi:MAG: OmpA family protein [Myxococcota bacterium]|nr:OmpA family protein [Myxococcota bacterium]
MKKSAMLFGLSVIVLCFGLVGCSISMSGSAKLNSAGSGAIIEGTDPVLVTAKQPAAPPPPAPVKIRKAKVVGKKIEINEKVMFDYNKATIKVDSHDLLTDVADVLKEHDKIEKVRVEGHTDSDGKDKYNKKLSQQRADAVKAFLVKVGIDDARLEAVGYGEEKPIADNATPEGKEKNRRVEFNIIQGSATEQVQETAEGGE